METTGSHVILLGKVRSYTEREEAERIAWNATGVYPVDNQLEVEWFFGRGIVSGPYSADPGVCEGQ